MSIFQIFIDELDTPEKKEKLGSIFEYIRKSFPQLKEEIRWNQPMYTDHGTFIIGFSTATNHISVAPEVKALEKFSDEIIAAGYTRSKKLFRIKFTDKIDFDLLHRIIAFNIEDKKDTNKFWRE